MFKRFTTDNILSLAEQYIEDRGDISADDENLRNLIKDAFLACANSTNVIRL
jgi:hypothetical protein